jgi:hypothetical protein
MNNCENCYHFHVCDLQYRLEEHQDCKHYKDKSLIVELPCKVGDTVYIKGEPVTIDFIHIDETISCCVTFDCYKRDCCACPFYEDDVSWEGEHDCRTQGYYEFTADDIGKTVFLTKEEAEKECERCQT